MQITFIGGGNMATALIAGLIQKGFEPARIRVVEIAAEHQERLRQTFGVQVYPALSREAVADATLVLAVKPQHLFAVATELREWLDSQLVISIAAGVRADDLSRWLGEHELLVRAMPNTPALVVSGITGLYALPKVDADQRQQAETILGAVGTTLWLEREAQMDAVTAVSGSGPAYVFYFMEALQEAGIRLGFAPDQARRLSVETFLGAARLALQSPEDLATLRARVTSKGGTTERAIQTMEAEHIGHAVIRAVDAACERSRELGDELGKLGGTL
jgi:pyrroline-5-carboxylate reductase